MNLAVQKRPRVLVADDDEINLILLREAIEGAGFEVTTVADGAAALSEGSTGHYDVVLLDVSMPELDGYSVCRALRASPLTSRLPVIMITSRDDSPSIDRAYDAGATDFIAKPVNWHLIPHRLRYVLRSAASEARIRELAYFDAVTGLPNRQSALQFITDALTDGTGQPAQRGGAIISLELCGLPRITENFGAPVADGILRAVAERLPGYLQSLLRDRAVAQCARTGDAGFVVSLCGPMSRALAQELADSIIRSLREPLAFQDHDFVLDPSGGIALFPEHGSDAEMLMMRAATARDFQETKGQAGLAIYSSEMGASSRERLALDVELRRAVRNEELQLYFQPKIRLDDGALAGVEALLRWFHPTRGDISPAVFIPLAEESGLILEIDAWVLRAACRQLRNWRDAGLYTSIAINVSGKHFTNGDPAAMIARETAAVGISPGDLTVEVTESVLMRDILRAQAGLQRLRALGCRVAIDDFGTGYSSLAYLKGLPVNEIKIDRAFIQDVHSSKGDAAIVRAVLGLSRSLGLRVTAEGVETQAQANWLRENGCDEIQGFLVGRAVRPHEITQRYGPGESVAEQSSA